MRVPERKILKWILLQTIVSIVYLIQLARRRTQRLTLMNTMLDLAGSVKDGEFLN
jgi:hypothetical protein